MNFVFLISSVFPFAHSSSLPSLLSTPASLSLLFCSRRPAPGNLVVDQRLVPFTSGPDDRRREYYSSWRGFVTCGHADRWSAWKIRRWNWKWHSHAEMVFCWFCWKAERHLLWKFYQAQYYQISLVTKDWLQLKKYYFYLLIVCLLYCFNNSLKCFDLETISLNSFVSGYYY